MLKSRANQDNLVTLLALCGVAAPIIFAILLTVAGIFYEGYSHVAQAVSELGGVEARYPFIQSTSFFVIGVLFLGFALALHKGIGGGRGSKLGPALVGVFGVSAGIGNALLPCDPGCEFQTLTGTMHNLTGMGGFIAAIAGIFVITRRLRKDPQWHSFYRFSWITGFVVLASLLLWIGVAKAAEVNSVNGLLQRLFVLVWFAWVEVMALRLFWLSRGHSFNSQPSSDMRLQ